MQPQNTPSAAEFDGYYNVPADPYDDGSPHLDTIPSPPPLRLHEVKRISNDVREVVYQYANPRGYTPNEIRNYYDMCVMEDLTDRTLNISFIDVYDCTIELVRQLRHLLATTYPLWRIRIMGSCDETTIMIYPSAVRYGSHPADTDEVKALTEVLRLEAEKQGRPAIVDQQRAILKRLIRSAIASGIQHAAIVVAGFDNYEGDHSEMTLWTLCRRDIGDLELLEPTEAMTSVEYNVKPDGDFGYHVGDDSPYWIMEWVFPSDHPPQKLVFKAYDANYRPFDLELEVPSLSTFQQQLSD
ncbi:MAG: hypothetical protein RMJ88_16350 [Thermogemmata sp.]|nr:hypothetical protein [Thermogemmata sp.]